MKILMIEDEKAIRQLIRFAFEKTEYTLLEAENCREAEKLIINFMPQLILLYWMLPGKSGIEFVKQLKANSITRSIPIIMLTAKAGEDNKVKALEIGADDYITKPFSPRELIARIKTVSRRGLLVSPENKIQIKSICLNIDTREVYINSQKLILSPTNY